MKIFLDFSSLTQLLRDDDNEEDKDGDGPDEDGPDDDNDNLMRLQNFNLNDIEGISEYKLMRLQRVHRNNANLASLGLLTPMMSATTLSSDRSNRKKRAASQDDIVRRVQLKRNAKQPTSYKDLDDHVILTQERRTLSAREYARTMRSTDPVAVTARRSTTMTRRSWRAVSLIHTFCRCLCFQHLVLIPSTPANPDRLHLDDRQYQSGGFYKAKKRLIDRYEEVSGGIKADFSPDPLPLPQEMKKQKNNYESWFAGHYPSPLQDGKSYTEKDGRATAFTTRMYENAVNSGLPPDKQLILGQMFDYFTDCTLGQVPFLADGENYCHNEHYLKGRLTDNAAREHWRNLRIDVFSRLIIDAINRKLVGARVLIIGVVPHIIFPSIIEEARSMAIEHFKEQGIDVKFDLQFIISPHFCSVLHGLNQEELAKMDNAVMQSQGNLLHDVNYFQQQWSHARKAKGDKMKNLITYLKTMNVEDKMNTRLDMLTRDGSPGHIHMINYFTKYRNEIFQYAIIKSDAKPSSIEELTILHLHSYLGMRGYIKGIKAMSA